MVAENSRATESLGGRAVMSKWVGHIMVKWIRCSGAVINPWHACAARVTVVVLCVCLCVCPFSPFCLLALLGIQREVSAAIVREMQ